MPQEELEDKPYTEGTLTKLEIFQLYIRAWLPVFTAMPIPTWKRLAVFDFFAGRGRDVNGTPGSAARMLAELKTRSSDIQSKGIQVTMTVADSDATKVQSLVEYLNAEGLPSGLKLDPKVGEFAELFDRYLPILRDSDVACLVFLDQYGFKEVDREVFLKLTECRTTDFLFFVSTHFLHRFTDHPAVRKYIELERPDDYFQAHRAVLDWYRGLIPAGREFYLAPFSFRKGSNIYGVIFGSSHPRGLEKFLSVAWQKDRLNGEADYDLNREDFREDEPFLELDMFSKPKKTSLFEVKIERAIREGMLTTERELFLFCLGNGMLPKHAAPVLRKLKVAGAVECSFESPSPASLKAPRPFRVTLADGK